MSIDNKTSPLWQRVLLPLHRRTRATLRAGEHTVEISYLGLSAYEFKLIAESGHIYHIRDNVQKSTLSLLKDRARPFAKVWIVDSATSKETGEVLFSRGEPLIDTAPVIMSPYFTWELPKMGTAMVMSRSPDSRTVGWAAADGNGHYAVSIKIFELPNLNAEDDFLSYVREVRRDEFEKANLKPVEEHIETARGRADFCAKYHQSVMQQAIGSPVGIGKPGNLPLAIGAVALAGALRPSTKIDSYGYYCRIPANKKFGLKFEYSHLLETNQADPQMSELAEKYFSQMKY